MGDLFDTRSKPDRERLEFWRDTVCREIFPVAIDPRHDAHPRAVMRCARFGDVGMRNVIGGDHVYMRSEADVKRGDPHTVQLGMPMRGTSILVQDGREAVLSGGDMVIYDSARPFTLIMEERFDWQVFLVSKDTVGKSDVELATITARRLDSSSGLPALVSHFLRDLAARAPEFDDAAAAAAVGGTVADLLQTMIGSVLGHSHRCDDPNALLREASLAFMDTHHRDPQLDPMRIAAAACVSVRRLHAAFEGTGTTVMDALRDIRLHAIRRDLHDPRRRQHTLAQVAASHGIPNATVFARLFRAEFGCTPSEFRNQRN
ncbi:helix-turn-helix domain-containing protein [Mycobacterium sp. OAE908]|uniref:AraC-like ligand-binding domain-containing protein n=1 Tax=Mycobacterium sp. OAE908 TaxID=2817899 RepID=UPI001AE6A29C